MIDIKGIVETVAQQMTDSTVAMILVTGIALSALIWPPSKETLELIEKIIICMGSLAVGTKIGK